MLINVRIGYEAELLIHRNAEWDCDIKRLVGDWHHASYNDVGKWRNN